MVRKNKKEIKYKGGLDLFKIKTIMIRDIHYVSADTPIYDAIKLLVTKNITGLPVVADDMSLVGIVSEKDMLKLLYDPDIEYLKVSDFMTHKVVSFDENDDMLYVCNALINNHFRRVPILSKGKLVGIVSRSDIINYILLKTSRHTDKKKLMH